MTAPGNVPDSVTAIMMRVLKIEGEAILSCAARLRQEDASAGLERALEFLRASLEQGGKIIVTGVGKSGKIAQKIAATLSSTGSLAVFLHPTEGLHGDLGLLTSRDVVIALSYTGNTDELVRLVPSLKVRNVPLIGIGGNAQSQLAQNCQVWIDASVEQEACPHNLAPTASTTLALAIGDALAVALMNVRGFDAKKFAANHPGGSLGRRMNLKVQDLMHPQKDIATLPASASMDEVVIRSSEKKLGAVLVVDGTKLLGIITDGDIRRALTKKDRFFQLRADEVMTRNPVTVTPETMAEQAFELMENRPSQISVLPVVNELGEWKGILRLHDVVRSF